MRLCLAYPLTLAVLLTGCTSAADRAMSTASPSAATPAASAAATATLLTASPTSPTQKPAPAAPAAPLHGLLSTTDYWDRTYPQAKQSDCAAQGAEPDISQHSWWLNNETLICTGTPDTYQWANRITGLYVWFPRAVSADKAIEILETLMPPDAKQIQSYPANSTPDQNGYPNGSCLNAYYKSDELLGTVQAINPSSDRRLIQAILFSANAGVGRKFDPDSVHFVMFGVDPIPAQHGCAPW